MANIKNVPYKSKDIEEYLIFLMHGGKLSGRDKYEIAAQKIFLNLLGNGIDDFHGVHKPKTKGKNRGSEPKTDVCFECRGKKYRLSVKMDKDAYIVSSNSELEFIKIFLDTFDGGSVLDADTIEAIRKTAGMISKVANFNSFDSNYGDDLDSFINDKFVNNKSLSKWTAAGKPFATQEKVLEYAEHIKGCYLDDAKKQQYVETLRTRESFLQNTIRDLFEKYPDYAKKIIFELLTGDKKFGNDDCASDCIADMDGFYLLDSPDCEYVKMKYESFMASPKIGRIQNVPRKSITQKVLKIGDKDLIAESFSIADLTFKL
jgi:hypothetical protein